MHIFVDVSLRVFVWMIIWKNFKWLLKWLLKRPLEPHWSSKRSINQTTYAKPLLELLINISFVQYNHHWCHWLFDCEAYVVNLSALPGASNMHAIHRSVGKYCFLFYLKKIFLQDWFWDRISKGRFLENIISIVHTF